MQDKDLVPVITIENTAWRFNNLPIARAPKFLRATATVRMVSELLDVTKDAFDNFRGRDWVLQCNVVCDCIKVSQRWLRPYYFSHLARRFLAWA